MLRHTTLFLLIGLLFFGSVGVNVFAHFCKADGTSISYLVPLEHNCAPVEQEMSCCHDDDEDPSGLHAENESALDQSSCCTEQMWNYKIPSDFHENAYKLKVDVQQTALPPKQIFVFYQNEIPESLQGFDYSPPPPKSGQEILIFNQVFRL